MQAVPGLSTGFQAATAMFEGVSQSNADRSAAAFDDQNAQQAELQGALNQTDIRRRGRAVQGEAIAALAEGEGMASGSARDAIFQNALDIEYAALNARFTAGNQARSYRARAGQERSAARSAVIGGVLRAGAAAVSGVQDARNQSREDAAYEARYNAYFPGGQQLPLPPPPPGPVSAPRGY
jgi:hypothetical protein